MSNQPPRTKWIRTPLACGVIRHRLYINEQEASFFVDDARQAGIAHFTQGNPVGLFGAGMGEEIRRRDGTTYRIAACIGGYRNIGVAKGRAEQMALA